MDVNKILLIIIVVLVSLIIIFGAYFLVLYLLNRKREKKLDNIFDPNNLVEEESLMNVMDDKKNVEFKKTQENEDLFVMNHEDVKIVTTDALSQEEKVNPFGVDLTLRQKDNTKIEIQDNNNQNKFIK